MLLISQATFSKSEEPFCSIWWTKIFLKPFDCFQSREARLTLPSSITTWPASSRAWKRQIHIRESLGPQESDKFTRKMQGLKMANSHLGKPRSTSTCKSGAGAEGGANPEMAAISRLVITESRAAWKKELEWKFTYNKGKHCRIINILAKPAYTPAKGLWRKLGKIWSDPKYSSPAIRATTQRQDLGAGSGEPSPLRRSGRWS